MCAVPGCDRFVDTYSSGLCVGHRARLAKHGDVLEDVPLAGRQRSALSRHERELAYQHRPEVNARRRALQRAEYAHKTTEQVAARRAYLATWRRENAERFKEGVLAWRRANRARVQAWARARAALIRGAKVVSFTSEQLEARLSMWPGCWMCGALADTVDHVKPVSKGGAHCLANLRPACRSCNSAKAETWPYDTARRRREVLAS